MKVSTDWQSLVAVCIALVCAAWMVRYVARPFVTRVAEACRKCDPPSPAEEGTGDLLQIAPRGAPQNQH